MLYNVCEIVVVCHLSLTDVGLLWLAVRAQEKTFYTIN